MFAISKEARFNKRVDEILSYKMDSIEKEYRQQLLDNFEAGIIGEEDLGRIDEEVGKYIPEFAAELVQALKKKAPRMLREHRSYRKGFEARNEKRWKEGFDKLEMLIVISTEMGQAVSSALTDKAQAQNDYRFEAVRNLHIRSVLTAREILCLMRGGFADGALGRWRTLHEISVVGRFLGSQDIEISKRYLLSRHCKAYHAGCNYQQNEARANLTPFGDEELRALKELRDQVVEEYGKEIDENEWGWAAPVIKGRANFAAIEKHEGLDHWRPRYRWACQDTHANHRPQNVMLGAAEAEEEVIIAMGSNSGMTDPADMMGLSLVIMAASFLTLEPNIDRTAGLMAMIELQKEVGNTFLRIERETYKKAHPKRRWFNL